MDIKEKIKNNDLSMPQIIAEFNTYKTNAEKAKFLREMGQLNLPYDVKWENLAKVYEGTKSWPKVLSNAQKNEDILNDYKSVRYIDPVGETDDEETLTMQELNALI